jgi:hypothetical protein
MYVAGRNGATYMMGDSASYCQSRQMLDEKRVEYFVDPVDLELVSGA